MGMNDDLDTHAYSWADEVGKEEGEGSRNGCCQRESTEDL